jgi:hypothetical protein
LLEYHFSSFHFHSVFVLAGELSFFQLANCWVLFFNPVNQSVPFIWRIKTIIVQGYHWKVCISFCCFGFFFFWLFGIIYTFSFSFIHLRGLVAELILCDFLTLTCLSALLQRFILSHALVILFCLLLLLCTRFLYLPTVMLI